ncbi:MAG: BC1881 family protein [Anaerostipes sp.]|nr:BC1881 family protein [Anaerostipes sp.]MDD4372265.1 BC1881 family protein [Anaerostipes sp.]
MDVKEARTCDLVEELKSRIGIETQYAEPDKKISVEMNGPVTVLIVTD